LLLVTACADDPVDPHAPTSCDDVWTRNGFTDCEAACVSSAEALGASGPACSAQTLAGSSVSCSKTFVFQDVTGCCASASPKQLFAECT
jgi:hypothetical protein